MDNVKLLALKPFLEGEMNAKLKLDAETAHISDPIAPATKEDSETLNLMALANVTLPPL